MLIGDLATRAGLSAKAIRLYEQAGLLPQPPRTPGGYRDYPAGAVDRLAFIRHAQAAGFTLADIRGVLAIRDSGQAPCEHVSALIGDHPPPHGYRWPVGQHLRKPLFQHRGARATGHRQHRQLHRRPPAWARSPVQRPR